VDVSSILFGYSKALYSNWIFYKPDHLLIDCGEGVASTLGNGNYGIEQILLTHGHIDHIAGLPSLLWSRAAGMGDNEKPLTIYHPRGDSYLADMQEYLGRTARRLTYELNWAPLDAGDEIALRDKRRAVTFATRHIPDRLTIGYKILESRRRLRAEYSHLSQEEIRAKAQSGGRDAINEIMETYEATLIVFGGDGLPLATSDIQDAEVLVHEATILDAADRKGQRHSTLDEAVGAAAKANVKMLLLQHLSGRYEKRDVEKAARKAVNKHEYSGVVWCLFHNRLFEIEAS
jgi:ribonuclease Z